jgi:sugar phosphate isomerase/epimerase
MKLACQENLLPGDDLLAKWETLSRLGYDGIELRGGDDAAFVERLPALRAARRAGVPMPALCLIGAHVIGDFDAAKRRDAIANMKTLLSASAELDACGAITPAAYGMHSNSLPPFVAPRPPEADRAVLIDGLSELGEHAAREGVVVLLEPLNRYGDHMLNRLEQAVELCKAVGLPSLRVVGDTYHMNIEERDLAAAIRGAGEYIKHMHLGDSNRLPPGQGHIDFAPMLEALLAIGYDGYLSLECNLAGEPHAALAAAARFVRGSIP